MAQIKKILFYIDGARGVEAGLDRVAAMARRSEAALTLVEVLDGIPRDLMMLVPSAGAEAVHELAMGEAYASLEVLAEQARQQGAATETKVLLGKPSTALIQEVERGGYDLLIVNAKRKAGLKEKVLGGTLARLMRMCPCPVLAIRPREVKRSGKILAAVAPEPGDEGRMASSVAVLGTAATLARAEGSELHIAHFWGLAGENILSRTAALPRYQMASLLRGTHHSVRAAVEDLVRRVDLGGLEYAVHLRKGEPVKLISGFVGRRGIDILVIGAPSRTGFANLLTGNLTEEVFWSVDCPVVTVRSSSGPVSMESRAA